MSKLDNLSPNHYQWHPVAECKDIAQEFSYNFGTAIAYIWRADRKHGSPLEDIDKAIRHLKFERDRLALRAQVREDTAVVPSFEQDDSETSVRT